MLYPFNLTPERQKQIALCGAPCNPGLHRVPGMPGLQRPALKERERERQRQREGMENKNDDKEGS